MRLDQIREIIEGDGPTDEIETRRLAMLATSRVGDPAQAAELHRRFLDSVQMMELAKAMCDADRIAEHRRDALAILDKIARQVG